MPTPAENLNNAVRELIEMVRTADLDCQDLGGQTGTIRRATDELRPLRHEGMRMQAGLRYENLVADVSERVKEANTSGVDEYALLGRKNPNEFFPYSPVVGALNPLAPPVRMWRADGATGQEMHGEGIFGAAYNGPPDCVHGGVIAEVFDELLGSLCVANGLGGYTGTLTIVYRSTTPLEQPLRLRGWHDRTEGRKVFAEGTLHDGDRLCAEATGIFIRSDKLPGGGVPPAAML